MMERFLPRPTQDTWEEVADGFWKKWNFPNCLGAIDGKHVTIQAPPLTGSQYFNYRKTFSIVLLALVDSNYRWRILHRRINLHPQHVDTLVMATCILHNFLLVPRETVGLLAEAEQQRRNQYVTWEETASREACNMREIFSTYFNSPQGSVSWQDRMV
ncbi:hypothetical protein D5F01_LYC13557 [Larimichthys crocea]|uniref:DDE Tnp4 domain-containing protein n=1 Tax=Larimichthys crocea TaxID=215358 RepID=A0A6G0I8F8_LARCR|nr:hypothetical protein D5F01_LYC13557 [Larimichthys crocea]